VRGTCSNHQKGQMAYHCWVETPSKTSAFCRTPSDERLDGRSLFPKGESQGRKTRVRDSRGRLLDGALDWRSRIDSLSRSRRWAGVQASARFQRPERSTPTFTSRAPAYRRLRRNSVASLTVVGGSSSQFRPDSSPTRIRTVPASNPGSTIQSTFSSQCCRHRRGWSCWPARATNPARTSDAPGRGAAQAPAHLSGTCHRRHSRHGFRSRRDSAVSRFQKQVGQSTSAGAP
jgi:hypothetical protein